MTPTTKSSVQDSVREATAGGTVQVAPGAALMGTTFALGLLNAAVNVTSMPIYKEGSVLTRLPIVSGLPWQFEQNLTIGIWMVTVAVATVGSVRYFAKKSPAAYRPFLWTALLNLGVIIAVCIAARM